MSLLRKISIIIGFVAILFAAGCHTIHGAGEDIEEGGQEIQEASE